MSVALGKRVRELRISAGLTLRQFGRSVDLSAPFLCDFEKGRRGTTAENLSKMATVLGVPVEELHALEGRLPDDLREWIENNPGVVALIRETQGRWLREQERRRRRVRA